MLQALTVEDWKDAVVTIAAVLVALGIIYRYAIRPTARAFRKTWQTVEEVGEAVAFVKAELMPNGGGSARDVLNRLDARGENHEERLVSVEKATALIPELVAAVAALEQKLREPVIASTKTTTKVTTVEPAHLEEAS